MHIDGYYLAHMISHYQIEGRKDVAECCLFCFL